MNNKTLIHFLLVIVCFALFQRSDAFSEEKLKITHGPYLIEPGENYITIVWFTNKNCFSWVEYCGDNNFGTFPNWGGYPEKARSTSQGLFNANTRKHVIRLTNLEPGKKYRYRIVSKEILQFDPYEVLYGDSVVGEISELETLDSSKKTFSFGAITDLHERAPILDTLLQNNPPDLLDLMFFTGDILNWIGDEERIFNGFIDVSVKHFAKSIPFTLTRGNHETRGPNARELFSYFPHSSGNYYHAFSHGEVRFIILDPGEDKPDTHPVYAGLVDFDSYRTEQAQWLSKEVQSEEFLKAKYKIALFHIPPYTDSQGHGGIDITKKWGSILNDANIDIVISGHHHRFSLIEPDADKNSFPVLILGQDMFLRTDVTNEKLKFTITDKYGKHIDGFELTPKTK